MANTYSQIYVQIVFTVQGRQNLISPKNRDELQKYITGIIQKRNQKCLAIFCLSDHVRILVSMKPSISISDLVRDIKAGSSNFINEQKWIVEKFNWQQGFGAFSYSKSHVQNVINYILNQEEHHKKTTFKEEYIAVLKEFEIE